MLRRDHSVGTGRFRMRSRTVRRPHGWLLGDPRENGGADRLRSRTEDSKLIGPELGAWQSDAEFKLTYRPGVVGGSVRLIETFATGGVSLHLARRYPGLAVRLSYGAVGARAGLDWD